MNKKMTGKNCMTCVLRGECELYQLSNELPKVCHAYESETSLAKKEKLFEKSL